MLFKSTYEFASGGKYTYQLLTQWDYVCILHKEDWAALAMHKVVVQKTRLLIKSHHYLYVIYKQI